MLTQSKTICLDQPKLIKYSNCEFDQTFQHDTQPPQSGRQHAASAWDYEKGTTPHDLYDTGHTPMMSMKACVQLQHDNMNNARDMTQTSAEIMMVQETDVLMVVSQARADEKKRNVTHMFHDMLPTQSMINTMGGGNVVTETNNSKYTSCMTEIMCGAGHCKQVETQTSVGECCIECAEDKLARRNELYNATHKIQHHTASWTL